MAPITWKFRYGQYVTNNMPVNYMNPIPLQNFNQLGRGRNDQGYYVQYDVPDERHDEFMNKVNNLNKYYSDVGMFAKM